MNITNVVTTEEITVIEILRETGNGLMFEYFVEYPDSADLYFKFGLKIENRIPTFRIKALIADGYFDKEG